MTQENTVAVRALKTGSFNPDAPIAQCVNERLEKLEAFVNDTLPQLCTFIGELQDEDYITSEGETVPGVREAQVTYDLFDRTNGKANGTNTINAKVDPLRVPTLFDRNGNPCAGEWDENGMYRLEDSLGARIKKDGEEVGENKLPRHAYFNTSAGMYSKDLANRYALAIFQMHEIVESMAKIRCFAKGLNPIATKRNPEAGVTLKLADAVKALQSVGGDISKLSPEQQSAIARLFAKVEGK